MLEYKCWSCVLVLSFLWATIKILYTDVDRRALIDSRIRRNKHSAAPPGFEPGSSDYQKEIFQTFFTSFSSCFGHQTISDPSGNWSPRRRESTALARYTSGPSFRFCHEEAMALPQGNPSSETGMGVGKTFPPGWVREFRAHASWLFTTRKHSSERPTHSISAISAEQSLHNGNWESSSMQHDRWPENTTAWLHASISNSPSTAWSKRPRGGQREKLAACKRSPSRIHASPRQQFAWVSSDVVQSQTVTGTWSWNSGRYSGPEKGGALTDGGW